MPKLKYFVQCDRVNNENGKYSAIGIFDSIHSLRYPIQHEAFSLLLGFTDAEPGKYEVELEIVSPTNKQICKTKGEFQAASTHQTINLVFNFEKFPLIEEGKYSITVFVQGDAIGEYSFLAQLHQKPREFTPEEKQILLDDDSVIHTVSLKINCSKCNKEWKLQLDLDETKLPPTGYLPFPPGNKILCSCGSEIDLTDTRLRFSSLLGLPKQVVEKMKKDEKGPNK